MAEHEEGIWGGEAADPARKRSHPAAPLVLPDRVGSEWGLASLLTGVACLVMCPTTLLVWASVVSVHAVRWSRADVRNICILLISCQFLVLGLVAMALAFAIVGLTAGRRQQTPVALPLAGLVVSAVTAVFWVIIIICSFATAFSL
jgi:hypothetical protein